MNQSSRLNSAKRLRKEKPLKKALILAAGLGTRLRPVTETIPKAMIPLLNHPIMEYTLALCYEHGIREVVINVHYFPERVKKYFGSRYKNIKITYSYEKELLENAGALDKVKKFFKGEEVFLVIASDNIANFDLTAMSTLHFEKKAVATIATTTADDPSKYGIVETDSEDRIKSFQEKPPKAEARSDQVATCCYLFSREIFKFIPPGKVSHFGKQIFPALLSAQQPMYAFRHKGYWNDVGNPSNYKQAVFDLMDAKLKHPLIPFKAVSFIQNPKAKLEKSEIGKYSSIDKRCQVKESVITKSLIFENVSLEKSRLNNCIISQNCVILSCNLKNVVLGENCVLENVDLKDCAVWPGAKLKKTSH